MLDPNLLTFLCVAECGSFNQAAKQLYRSAPSVMKQVNALEKRLGLSLLERTNQGVRLTAAGQVIQREGRALTRAAEQAVKKARAAGEPAGTIFRVGSSILNPCEPFMPLWDRVRGAFPGGGVRIVPVEDDHQDILSVIASLGQELDFLVGVCDSRRWMDRCRFYPLGECEHVCAVSRDHPLAGKTRLTPDDLRGQTLMMVQKGDSPVVDALRTEVERWPGVQIEDTAQFYDMEVFNRCAESGNVLVTPDCWRSVHPLLVTIPAAWHHPIPYGLMYAKSPSAAVQRFLDELQRTE